MLDEMCEDKSEHQRFWWAPRCTSRTPRSTRLDLLEVSWPSADGHGQWPLGQVSVVQLSGYWSLTCLMKLMMANHVNDQHWQ